MRTPWGFFAVFAWTIGCSGPSTQEHHETPDSAASGVGTSGASGGAGTGSNEVSGSTGIGDQSETGSGSSSTGTGGDAAAPDPKTACVEYVQGFCERDVQCGALDPTNLSGCTESAALCPDLIFSAGSSRTPSQAEACATDVLAQSCDAFNAGAYLPCQSPGTRTAGQPCNYNSQCATFRCLGTETGACGSCAQLPASAIHAEGTPAPAALPCPARTASAKRLPVGFVRRKPAPIELELTYPKDARAASSTTPSIRSRSDAFKGSKATRMRYDLFPLP